MNERIEVNYPAGTLELEVNALSGFAEDFIGFAARANAKRAFLFMSKVLGKHYPVSPLGMQYTHDRLAAHLGVPSGPVVFIGMAETATGLGQGVYESWMDLNPGQPSMYLHTTRYRVADTERVVFEESHSHAPNVFLTLPTDPWMRSQFEQAKTVVLVDDELSTGNTFVNLVSVLRKLMPRLSMVNVATIADFVGEERRAELAERMGLPCSIHAMLHGQWRFTGAAAPSAAGLAQQDLGQEICIEDAGYGRLGRIVPVRIKQDLVMPLASQCRVGKTLVLGTGEFMHAAFVLGLALERHGCDVRVQATTRSPILEWGAISSKMLMPDAYGDGVTNYLYNVHPDQYERILVCHESGAREAVHVAQALQGQLIQFGNEDHVQEDPFH